ncbi:glycosyltransferase family protein [Dyadobacter aurulentus]|uniref:glycosyltransferase family protein n=1 Tax=Dyadobacter sp. UC 10 TaxID=2605428 RepID=UPI0011F15825|nr:glycosyltransferase [Dyadobacter sp. UC 10]KAA0993782.1 glycosyltransferase family 1 protein [Dyadobacter sp. UC 10]
MKLKGHQIIVFGLPRFDSKIESTNYTIAKMLARDNQVFYVEHPFTIKDYIRLRNEPEIAKRKGYFDVANDAVIDTDVPDLKVVVPPVLLSINFLPEGKLFRTLLKMNEGLIRAKLKRIIRKYRIKDFIYINSFNFHYPNLIEGLAPKLTAYHCVDPIVVPFDARHGGISESELIKKSDLVFCTSRQLFNNSKVLNTNTYFVPNAADIRHSQKALDPDLPVAAVLKDIPQPVIGYFGNIERRMDYDMLEKIIGLNSDKSFVFVGPQDKSYIPDWFFNTPNVYATGSVPYSEMPAVIKGFDVALLPFKRDKVSATIFPLKLFEYLGAGKPLVSINFNDDLTEFTGDAVAFCDNADSFSEAISDALHNDTEVKKQRRIRIAEENTWDKRVGQISELLADALSRK